jgi:eukaryotic-like serine/threonine-protein kinase
MQPPGAQPIGAGSLIAGRYLIRRVIGRGGYGAIYEAEHTGTKQGVAIKTLAAGLEQDDLALKRFFQEARVTAGLRHPNTIRVFDFGQDDSGLLYIAMELLTGVTLKQELKARQEQDRAFTEREAIDIGVQVTRSLGEAHAAGLVHRDLKPDNIFLAYLEGDEPIVKVLDFGIAKLQNESLTLGGNAGIPGTPAYMSPEQVTQEELDGRSDLYSLGVVLYSLIAGAAPFKGQEAMQVLYSQVHHPPPDLRSRAKTPISDDFARVIHRALEKDPAKRPASAKEMRAMLQACIGEGSQSVSSSLELASNERVIHASELEPTLPSTSSGSRAAPSLFLDAESDAAIPLSRLKGAGSLAHVHTDAVDPSMPDVHSMRDVSPPRRGLGRTVLFLVFVAVLGLTAGGGFFVSHVLMESAVANSILPLDEAPPAGAPLLESKAAPATREPAPPKTIESSPPKDEVNEAGEDPEPAKKIAPTAKPRRSGRAKRSGGSHEKKGEDVLDMKI